jgi:hypothetical protein
MTSSEWREVGLSFCEGLEELGRPMSKIREMGRLAGTSNDLEFVWQNGSGVGVEWSSSGSFATLRMTTLDGMRNTGVLHFVQDDGLQ